MTSTCHSHVQVAEASLAAEILPRTRAAGECFESMTSRSASGARLQTGSHYGRDTQPDSNSSAGVFDPAVKAIAAVFMSVGAAVVLARLSFFFF